MLLDIVAYWIYRAYHDVPLLWRLHVIHHSDVNLDVSSASRFHPGEVLLSSAAADILLRRVMFAATQIAAAEANLKMLDDENATLRGENVQIEAAVKGIEREAPDSESRRMQLTYAKNRMAAIQERLSAMEQERVAAQNELQTLRHESREWQTLLDKALVAP